MAKRRTMKRRHVKRRVLVGWKKNPNRRLQIRKMWPFSEQNAIYGRFKNKPYGRRQERGVRKEKSQISVAYGQFWKRQSFKFCKHSKVCEISRFFPTLSLSWRKERNFTKFQMLVNIRKFAKFPGFLLLEDKIWV